MLEDTLENNRLKEDFLSYNPEEDYNGSIGISLADAAFRACGHNHQQIKSWAHGEKISFAQEDNKYLKFYQAVEKNNLYPFNVYTDSGVKAKIIKETIGYTKLRTGKGVSTPIEKCAPEVVGEVFKRLYQTSLKEYQKVHFSR